MGNEVKEKPQEVSEGRDNSRDVSSASDNREIKTAAEAQRDDLREKSGAADKDRTSDAINKNTSDAALALNSAAGKPNDIAGNKAVQDDIAKHKTVDLQYANKGTFDTAGLYGNALDGIKKNGGEKLAMAGSLKVGDQTKESLKPGEKGSEHNKPGDNNVRDIDPAKDNPAAVAKRYNDMVDSQKDLKPGDAERLKSEFADNMAKMQEKFKGDDLSHISRSMNLMMDKDNHLMSDKNRINAVSGLAARGAEPQDANRQGANPTCALTSESRIEQQRDFVKYADQMGSVAAKGGAWRGGADGKAPVWVDVDAKGTNHANFAADGEASRMYSKDFHQNGGHRDYLGQLDNAVVGGEMAKYAGQRDGKDYVYVAANAQKVDGADALSKGQASGGNTLMVRDSGGELKQSRDGQGNAENNPPSTLDMVAKVNAANGGGGLMVQQNLAEKYRDPKTGQLPEGMVAFKDAADLRGKLAQSPDKEYQIATNGVIVAGREGHGLHAQTVKLNKDGQLEFGNNWDNASNHKVYNDDFVNKFTNPKQWDNYTPQHTLPDGQPDWRNEKVGPKTDLRSVGRDSTDPNFNKDKADKDKKEEEDKKKDAKAKEEKENEEKQKADAKAKAHQQAQQAFDKEMSDYKSREAAWEKANPGKSFNETPPVFKNPG